MRAGILLSISFLFIFVFLFLHVSFTGSTLSLRHDRTIELAGQQLMVQVADDPAEREEGLIGKLSLNDDEGMLFLLGEPSRPIFWMKDMQTPIDLVWVMDDRVVGWIEHLPPDNGEQTYRPALFVEAVLELPAGWIVDHDLEVGDPVSV